MTPMDYRSLNTTLITKLKKKINELNEAKEKYRTIIENTTDIIYSYLPDGTISYISPGISKLGYTPDEVIGHNMVEFIHPDDRKFVISEVKKYLETGSELPTSARVMKKDGSPVWVEESSKIVHENGQIIKLNGVIRDITERKKAEDRVRENEAKFRAIFDGANDGILVADVNTKKFLFANPSICRMTGYSEKEIMGLGVNQLHPKKDLPYVLGQFKKQMQGKITLAENMPVMRKNKTVVYCDINSAAVRIGNNDALIGFFRDVTERRMAEDKIKESEGKYRALINTTDTGYVILDSRGIVLDANPEYIRLAGRRELSEIKGRSVMEWTAKYDLKRNIQEVKKCFEKGFVRDLDVDYVDKKGKITSVEVNATVIDSKNGKIVVTLCRDITERKKAEQLFERRYAELQCMFVLGQIIEESKTDDEIFDRLTKELRSAMQYPDEAVSKVMFDNKVYPKGELCMCPKKLSAGIIVNGVLRGEITICYKRNSVFLNEEKSLINAVAERIGRVIERKNSKKAMEESESKYRSLVENATDAIFMVDTNLKFVSINSTICKVMHRPYKDIIGKSVLSMFPKETAARFAKNNKEVIKTGKRKFLEEKMVVNGMTLYNNTVLSPIKDSTGKVVAVMGIVRDVTEAKKAQETVKESEKFLHAIFDSISDGLIVADAQSSKFVYSNHQICRITGYTEKELLKLSVNDIHAKKDLPYVLKQFERMAKGEISVVKNIPVQRKDRTIVHCDISARLIDVNGRKCMAGLFRDTSKEMIAEEKIKESEEKFRILYESSADAIMTLEPPTWAFTSGNPATVKMFKAKSEKDFTSRGPWEVSPKYQTDGQLSAVKAKKMIMKAMKKGLNFFEWTHRRINGEDFPATVLLTRLTLGGKTFLQATVRDITAVNRAVQNFVDVHEQFKVLVDDAPDLIQSVKPDGSFNYVNKEWKRTLGYSDKDIKKMKLWNVIKKEHIKTCKNLFKRVMSGHKLTGVRTEFVSKNRKPVALIGDINPIKRNGKVIETIGVFRREDKSGHLLKTC